MAELKLSFSIPDWLYRYRWSNLNRFFRWYLKPNKCVVCGSTTIFRSPEVEWLDSDGHVQMLGQANVEDNEYSNCLCLSCVAEATAHGEYIPKRGDKKYQQTDTKDTCDHCGGERKSYRWTSVKHNGFKLSLIVGNHCSWNSTYYCRDCIHTIFSEGVPKSGVLSRYQGKFVYLNNFGLPVVDGKVRFPAK